LKVGATRRQCACRYAVCSVACSSEAMSERGGRKKAPVAWRAVAPTGWQEKGGKSEQNVSLRQRVPQYNAVRQVGIGGMSEYE